MAKLTLTVIAAAGLALSGVAFLGCTPSKNTESVGEFIDDSVITTKVKAAVLEEPSLKSLQISVKCYKGVVQLSGFVDSAESARLAGKVASGVPGVLKVTNDLIVK
jgi:osmotically-inducible protein OsmY